MHLGAPKQKRRFHLQCTAGPNPSYVCNETLSLHNAQLFIISSQREHRLTLWCAYSFHQLTQRDFYTVQSSAFKQHGGDHVEEMSLLGNDMTKKILRSQQTPILSCLAAIMTEESC